MSFKVLESVLRPLSYWYTQDNIEEVAITAPGRFGFACAAKGLILGLCIKTKN